MPSMMSQRQAEAERQSVQTQLPVEVPAIRLGGRFARPNSGETGRTSGYNTTERLSMHTLLGFRWVAREHALAASVAGALAVFSGVPVACRAQKVTPGSLSMAAPSARQNDAA
jgi:hypothetical protein